MRAVVRSLPGTALLGLLCCAASASAQVQPYGTGTPAAFSGSIDSGGRLPFVGSPFFGLRLVGAPNPLVSVAFVCANPASIPIGGVVFLVDPSSAALLGIPGGQTVLSLPIPSDAALAGAKAYAQVAVVDPALPMGFGLTNGLEVGVFPDPTPTRATFGIQDHSPGGTAPGGLAVLDLTTTPPSFRATGPIGFSGPLSVNFSPKIAVADAAGIAFALGNDTVNGFVRALDVSSDPIGVVTYPVLGDTPVALPISSTVGWRDLEVTSDGALLFVTSGGTSPAQEGLLEVFDVAGVSSGAPGTLMQSISFPAAGGGPLGLDLAPDDASLALVTGADLHPPLSLYAVDPASPAPLAAVASFALAGFALGPYPNDVHFAPDASLLFVTGGNGTFAVIDATTSPPSVSIDGGSWPVMQTSSVHGSAVAVMGGTLVGIVGDAPTTGGALYSVVDLNQVSPSYGAVVGSFTTNLGGNISNHRIHARGSIVVAVDGTAPPILSQLLDVIDLDGPPLFLSWRIQTPSTTSLVPAGVTSIPRDFDLH